MLCSGQQQVNSCKSNGNKKKWGYVHVSVDNSVENCLIKYVDLLFRKLK